MKGDKGKAPTFQFYVKDWLSDEKLMAASFSTQAIWLKIMFFMWLDNKSHELKRKPKHLINMLGCTKETLDEFFMDAIDLNFCDIKFDFFKENDKFSIDNVHLVRMVSRRFKKDNLKRAKWAVQKAGQRKDDDKKEDVQGVSDESPPLPPIPPPIPPAKIKDIHMCPYLQIIEIYHTTLPSLPEVSLSDNLKKRIKARWKEHKVLSWWQWYFDGVSECPYLIGKVNDWAANFHWLLGPKNMTKVLNGQYVDRKNMKEKQIFDNFDKWLKERANGISGQ
jgi:hypothetical protein